MSPTDLLCPRCQSLNSARASICDVCGAALSPARSPSTLIIGGLSVNDVLQSGRYVIEGFLGRGGMGTVYRVRDTRLEDKRWAIKEMSHVGLASPEEVRQGVEAFRREAAMLAHLSHRNLPKVIDNFEENGRQYLVMDLVEGQTLSDVLLKQNQPLPVAQVLVWTEQLCDALGYLHRQRPPIIFRDLKPDNIMVDKNGDVKLIDFGIARHFTPGKKSDTMLFGTFGYAPPEQYGGGQTDARSDEYALAATLHHVLTGRDPTQHSSFVFPPARQLNPAVPDGFSAALQKALSPNPGDRWATVDEFCQAISPPHQAQSIPSQESSSVVSSGTHGNGKSYSRAPFPRFVSLGRSSAYLGQSLICATARVSLRPIIWLLPFPGIIRGVVIAALVLALMMLVVNDVIRVPPLIPVWTWLASQAGELVLLGSIAQVTGVSIVLILQVLFSLLVLPLGGLLGFLTSTGPKINPPEQYIANQECIGRDGVIRHCRSRWNEIAGKKESVPTFVVLCGKPGVGKTTVIKHFFLLMEEEIQKAIKIDGASPREVPYHYLLWIDCSTDDHGLEQLLRRLSAPLRAYYRVKPDQRVFADACAHYLQSVNAAIFIDQLDLSAHPGSLGFWDPFLRSLAKRRPSRLSIWVTANDAGCDYFRNLGQQKFELIRINPLRQKEVARIVANITKDSETSSLQWVRAHWDKWGGDMKLLKEALVKKNENHSSCDGVN